MNDKAFLETGRQLRRRFVCFSVCHLLTLLVMSLCAAISALCSHPLASNVLLVVCVGAAWVFALLSCAARQRMFDWGKERRRSRQASTPRLTLVGGRKETNGV
jgi:NADH:ubiquinone oxidoreductase subunit 6 (subunit J)